MKTALIGFRGSVADGTIKVGPLEDGWSYAYSVLGYRSAATYHNAPSARRDAHRSQILNSDGTVTPVLPNEIQQAHELAHDINRAITARRIRDSIAACDDLLEQRGQDAA